MLARLELFGRFIQLTAGKQTPPGRPNLHVGSNPPLRTMPAPQWRLGFHIQPRLEQHHHDQ